MAKWAEEFCALAGWYSPIAADTALVEKWFTRAFDCGMDEAGRQMHGPPSDMQGVIVTGELD